MRRSPSPGASPRKSARANPKQILGALTRQRLLQLAALAGIEGVSGKRKDEVVETLAGSRRLSFSELLALYSRDELKSACEADH